MNALIDGAWALLADSSLKAALVAGIAWLVLAVWRPRNASVRHGVWAAALGAMLALPWLTLIAPRVAAPAGWYPRWSVDAAGAMDGGAGFGAGDIRQTPVAATIDQLVGGALEPMGQPVAAGFERPLASAAEPANVVAVETRPPVSAATGSNGVSSAAEPPRMSFVERVKVALVIIYFGAAPILLARVAAGMWTTRRIVDRARAAATPLAGDLLPAGTRLLESDDVFVPVATGLWRSAVLLPADWRLWSEPLLRCVLAHEGAHVRRRDPWVAALAAINRAVLWFHPAAWVIQRQLAALAEQVCDDAVIEATGQRAGYARELVSMAARVSRGRSRVAVAGVAMARRACVEDRVEAIIDESRPLARRIGRRRVAMLAAIVTPLVVMAAGLRAQVAAPQGEGSAKPQAAVTARAEGDAAADDAMPQPELSGRLVDETGAPVTDARLDLSGPDYFHAESDDDGRYKFDAIKEGGEYRLIIETEKWVGFNRTNVAPRLVLKPGEPAVRDFTLPRACMIRVRTLDEAGQPVAGVRVLPMPAHIDSMDWPNGLNYHGGSSNKEGWAEFGVPPSAEPYHLATMSDDYAFARMELTVNDPSVITLKSVTLSRGVEVRGTAICSDGKPAVGWGIQIEPTWWNFLTSPNDARIGEDGSFTLPHVAPGRYHVSLAVATGEGMTRVSRVLSDVELPPAGGVLELKLNEPSPQSMGAIAGRVRFVDGEPKGVVSVDASPESGGQFASGHVERGGNSFQIKPVPPGRYRVRFSSPDIEEKVVAGVTAPVDDLDVELKVVGRPTLRGRVTQAGGAAATRFRARVEKTRTLRGPNYVPDAIWREVDDPAGEFAIDVPGPGVYRLVVEVEGFAPARSVEINTDEYDGKPVPLELNAGATLTGTVVDAQGAPIAGARVIPLYGMLVTRGRQAIDVATLGVETDAEGRFTLERLAPGQEYLRASHPDYAFTLVQDLTLTAGENRAEPIVLKRGGVVRGRVFDENGQPLAGAAIMIRRDVGFNDGNRDGRDLVNDFGDATTDAEGRYEVSGLPEELCYVSRKDSWQSLGFVRQAIRPTSGATLTLDLGGERPVRGRLLVNGRPLAQTRIQLGDQPHFGAFKAYAMTDAEGRFTFWSPAAGARKLYYAAPGKRDDWVLAAKVTIEPSALDLGDINVQTSTVEVTVQGMSREEASAARVTLQAYNPNWPFGDDAGMAAPRSGDNDAFTFVNVLPGEYEASCVRPDGVTLSQRVTVPAGGDPVGVTLIWKIGAASITGPIDENTCGPGFCNPPNLWSRDGSIHAVLLPREGKNFSIDRLPAGEYYLANYDTRDAPAALEFSLAAGEKKLLDLAAAGYKPQVFSDGALYILCSGDNGVPLPGVKVALTGNGKTLTPHSSQEGRVVFTGPAGAYRMVAEFPGMERVEREVTLKASDDSRINADRTMELRMRPAR